MEGSGNSACKGPEEVSPAVRRKPAVVGNIHRFAHSTGFLGDCHTALNVLLGCGWGNWADSACFLGSVPSNGGKEGVDVRYKAGFSCCHRRGWGAAKHLGG